MSIDSALPLTFMGILSTFAPLVALLATDPNTGNTPAIFADFMNDSGPPAYDSISFNGSYKEIPAFEPSGYPGATYQPMYDAWWNIVLWSQSSSVIQRANLAAAVDGVFKSTTFPLSDASGNVRWSHKMTSNNWLFDKTLKAFMLPVRYHWVVQEYSFTPGTVTVPQTTSLPFDPTMTGI